MDLSFYSMAWTVLIYAFFGWCVEVLYAAVNSGKFVNRGFLNGPVCPIYGFGMLLVLAVLGPVRDNPILLFLGGMLLTSFLEFLTGFILEKLFHQKWWDYSNTPFNLCGYICLKFSVLWGAAVVLVINVVERPIEFLLKNLPSKIGMLLLSVLLAAFLADFILTLIAMLKLPKRLRAMEEIEAGLKKVSNEIGERLYTAADRVMTQDEKLKENLTEKRGELEERRLKLEKKRAELEERYKKLTQSTSLQHRRILKAFPKLSEKRTSVKNLFEALQKRS